MDRETLLGVVEGPVERLGTRAIKFYLETELEKVPCYAGGFLAANDRDFTIGFRHKLYGSWDSKNENFKVSAMIVNPPIVEAELFQEWKMLEFE